MTNIEKHRQDSTPGVDAWVETNEHASESEGFSAAAHFLAGDNTPDSAPEHRATQEDTE